MNFPRFQAENNQAVLKNLIEEDQLIEGYKVSN